MASFEFGSEAPLFELEEALAPSAVIKVVGVGGAGGNAVDHMIDAGIRGVEFIALNTDMQALMRKKAAVKLQIGAQITGGKGAGADPEVGRRAALESEAAIADALRGADMVFIAAGMGKGTGTGAAPVVAEISRSLGILTLPVVTRPFSAEGDMLAQVAEQGVQALSRIVDSVLIIPNDRLVQVAPRMPLHRAYLMADDTLRQAVQSISDVIAVEGQVNCDFNDVRSIMTQQGGIYMGVGSASGEGSALRAAQSALSNPYLENLKLVGALGTLVNITCRDADGFTTEDLQSVLKVVQGVTQRGAKMIYGLATNETQPEDLRVTVIATGMNSREAQESASAAFSGMHELAARPDSRAARPVLAAEDLALSSEDLEIPTFLRRRVQSMMEKARA